MTPTEIINTNVGLMARMLSMDKRAPEGHVCVWNANLIVDKKKVWFGDLDLTADALALQLSANEIGKPIIVIYERAGRFDNEENPDISEPVQVINPS